MSSLSKDNTSSSNSKNRHRHQSTTNNNNGENHQRKSQIPMSGVPFGYVPAFLPGSASLVEQLDRRIMIVLRDGRHLVGVLRSFDQFSNMVLDQTSERRVLLLKKPSSNDDDKNGEITCYYTDIPLGLYLVRGDSMVLLGEVEIDTDDETSNNKESVVTAGYSSSAAAEGLTGSGLLMGTSIEKQESKKRMKKVTLKKFEEIEAKMKEKKEGEDPIHELTWEFDLDLLV